MSLAALRLPMSRPVGRPRADESPDERAKHIECAQMFFGANPKKWPVKRIAASFEISRDTVYDWVRRSFGYTEPEAQQVREMARRSTRRIDFPSDDA